MPAQGTSEHYQAAAGRIQQHPILAAAGYGIFMQSETTRQLMQGETTRQLKWLSTRLRNSL